MTSVSTATSSSTVPLLDRLQASAKRSGSSDVSSALLNELLLALERGGVELDQGNKDIEDTLFTDPFPLLALLLPVLSNLPTHQPASALARTSLLLIATHSSAKEVVLAVGERVDELKMPEDSDEEAEWDDEHAGDEDGMSPWDPKDAALQLAVLVEMFTIALPRIRTPRPLKFLTPVVEPLVLAIAQLTFEGAFVDPMRAGTRGEDVGAVDERALTLYEAVLRFVQTLATGSWIDCGEGEFRTVAISQLSAVLDESTGLLHPFIPSTLASQFFYSHFPRYRIPGRAQDSPPSARVEEVWKLATSLLQPLGYNPSHLLTLSTSRFASPHSRLGSFVLLIHLLASSSSLSLDLSLLTDDPSRPPPSPSELLRKSLGVLKMPFEQGMLRLGEDEVLWWCWAVTERHIEDAGKKGGEGMEEEALFPLIEILSSLSALSPSPSTRFLSFRLITRLILSCTGPDNRGESTQLMLLKDLIADTPYQPLRVAAVGLVKEVMAEKLKKADETPSTSSASLLLSPLFLTELSPSLFRLDPPVAATARTPFSALEADMFVEHHYRGTMERLGLVYFLVVRDRKNATGLLSPRSFTSLSSSFLDPLRTRLDEWLEAPQEQDRDQHVMSTRMQVEVVRELVERIDGAVETRRS